ncbi:MAG: hypothetical protein AAB905_00775 [Patescibacteria group bacterium]
MINKSNNQPDANSIGTSNAVFIQYYNENIPATFPHATAKTLDKFQASHLSLFKESGEWIIDKHRKKFMDWLVSNWEVDNK